MRVGESANRVLEVHPVPACTVRPRPSLIAERAISARSRATPGVATGTKSALRFFTTLSALDSRSPVA